MGKQSGQFAVEHPLGQPDGFLEQGLDAVLLLLVDRGREPGQVRGRFQVGEAPSAAEGVAQIRRVVGRVEERAELSKGLGPEVIEVPFEIDRGLAEPHPVGIHLTVERLDLVKRDQSEARLREGEGLAPPVRIDLAA